MKIYFQNIHTNNQINFCSLPYKPKQLLHGVPVVSDTFQRCISDIDLAKIPIKNDEEFNRVFSRIVNEISNNGEYIWYSDKDHELYRNIGNIERGLIPYCGYNDKSKYINMFLSGRLTPEAKQKYNSFLPMNEQSFIDVIRCLEYSLNYLDKQYGKYKGIVFRQGFMSEKPNQYISSSKSSIIANCWNDNYQTFHRREDFLL